MIVILDNHDSFTQNIRHALEGLGAATQVVRAGAGPVAALEALAPTALVLSAGPGRPEEARDSLEAIGRFGGRLPLLGICLGHQCLCLAHGAQVGKARRQMHGKTCQVSHQGQGLFEGLAQPMEAARYNSLTSLSTPPGFSLEGWDEAGEIMAVARPEEAMWGVQFHPESFLTPQGPLLLANFLRLAQTFHRQRGAA